MSDHTKIEWADATANYVNGCSVVSPGCTNCYAMRLAGTRMKHHPTRAGLTDDTKAGPVWNGTIRTNDKVLAEVLGWAKPRRIFWNAHGDLCVLHRDRSRFDGEAMFQRPAFEQGSGAMSMFSIGKARAGRLLDGVQHDASPA